jgi:hypothetical protein
MFVKQPPYLCNVVECVLLEVGTEFVSGFKGVSGTYHSHRWCSRSHRGYIIDDGNSKVQSRVISRDMMFIRQLVQRRTHVHTHTHI